MAILQGIVWHQMYLGFRGKDRSMTTTFVSKKSTLILNDVASVLEMASQPTVRGRNECS